MKNQLLRSLVVLGTGLGVGGTARGADCASLTINALDTGWYDASGQHTPSNGNYICADGYRDWFVFNIPALTQPVASAALRIFTFDFDFPNFETYELRHVSTPIATLRAGGNGLTAIYADLGDGTVYGSRTFFQEDHQYVTIPLNAAFVSNLTAASGGALALGGQLVSLDALVDNEYLFAGSDLGSGTNSFVQLIVNYSNASPLTIVQEPVGLGLLAGGAASFQVRVCGGGAPSYQWQRSETNLPGATNPFLQRLNAQPGDSGSYRVLVTDTLTTVTSLVATLTVSNGLAPAGNIFLSSGESNTLAGATVYMCNAIFGVPSPSVQWQFNGTNLPSQNGSCLYLQNLQTNQSGDYRVVAVNPAGAFTSAPISLVVTQAAPTGNIYVGSGTLPAPTGSGLTLCSAIVGGPTPNFQWQFNGVNLAGQINQCLYLSNLQSNQAGLYRIVASNVAGIFTSAPIAVAVSSSAPAGSISFSSGPPPAPAGSAVTICSSITAAPPPSYQWQFNGVNLPGQVNSCLVLPNVSSNQAGSYRVVASNSAGVFTSAAVALSVYYEAPFGSISPSGVVAPLPAGIPLSISSSIFGAPYPGFQWQFNGMNLPGENSTSLYVSNPQTNQSGSYRLIASNVAGSFTSAVAVVSIIHAPPTATIHLGGGHSPTTVGSSLMLCSSVSGSPSPNLQWRFNGTNLPGQTNYCLNLPDVQTNQSGGYTIVASNILGVATSVVALISVIEPVAVLASFYYFQPPLAAGTYAYLCASVTLPEPATLQWRFNGTNLPGAVQTCFEIQAQPETAGDYSVVATTATSGAYTSPPIALTVYSAPPTQAVPTANPSFSPLAGQDVYLSASYAGSPSFIQWRFNGTNLPGQIGPYLSLLGVTTNQAGQYSFTATNLGGMTTSAAVTLTVGEQSPRFTLHPHDQSVVEGNTALFQAQAVAGPPPLYFLEHDGTNVAVPFIYATCCTPGLGGFSLLDTTLVDAGNYRIIASNYLGTATSAVVTLTVFPAGPLDRWTQRNPLPQSQPLFAVAHGTNQFVAVGDRGTILTSPDGSNWALQNRRADVAFDGVIYGGGLFVAVGASGTILSSADGTNWSYRYTASGTILNAVTYGNGRFVAVGSTPTAPGTLVLHSADGINWERVQLNSFYAQQCVAYGNGLFVAAGSGSIMTSTDGANWNLVQATSTEVESVTYADGYYVAVGDNGLTFVSSNGASWVARTPVITRRLLGVTYGAGRFVAAGARGNILTSTDTITWTSVASGTPDRLETIDFAGGIFVAAGENGTIITSTNGTIWTKQNFGVTRDLDGMESAQGTLVVVGKGGSILTSSDGVHYSTQNAGVTNDLHGVIRGGGLWVAVGEPGIVLTSTNAVDWTSHATGTTNSLKDATYADGQWIVVGTQGTIVRSTNGVNWAATFTSPPYDLNDVAYGNGMFLVAGDGPGDANGSLFRSSDGVTWTQVAFYAGKNLRGVTFENGLFVLAANDGVIYTTTNAVAFSLAVSFGGDGQNLRAATWAHGLWIVVGNNGLIATSPDLVTWTRRASRTFENQHQVALLDGKLVVIGNRGTILQSARFVSELDPPTFVAGTGFRLPFKGAIGRAYQIQATTNLVNWTSLATFTNLTEDADFTDTNALPLPWRFYRLVEP